MHRRFNLNLALFCAGGLIALAGGGMLIFGSLPAATGGLVAGCGLMLLAVILARPNVRRLVVDLKKLHFDAEFEVPKIARREAPADLAERQAHAEGLVLPGGGAGIFSLVASVSIADAVPAANSMTPMYMLDSHYRITDWNLAFNVGFDRTMEGRRGLSVQEWVYFLDNYEEVLAHGEKAFADPDSLPRIDVEMVRYTSQRYGLMEATKRAYQIPKDDGSCLGWLVTLQPTFATDEMAIQYRLDLIALLRQDLMWTEYALSYDRVLNASRVYPKLIATLLGETGDVGVIPPKARVIDLGAGTGNITKRLMDGSGGRLVIALEQNRAMLETLKSKCKPYVRTDADGPGVICVKQDINSLFGIQSNYFDVAILNNVTYTLADPMPCLREVARVLKPGGEVRLSGPQKKTRVRRVLKRIRRDLAERRRPSGESLLEEFKDDFERVKRINELQLGPDLGRWTVEDVKKQLLAAGFSTIRYEADNVYAGQSMLVCATK